MLANYQKQIEYCTYCPKMCRFACPVAEAEKKETVTPAWKMSFLHFFLDKAIDMDTDTSQLSYKCLGCLLCTEFCEHEIQPPLAMYSARAMAIEKGIYVDRVSDIFQRYDMFSNPTGKDLHKKLKDLLPLPQKYFSSEAHVIYFPGCITINNTPQNIIDTFNIFERLGVDYVGINNRINCCGGPLFTLGDQKRFKKMMEDNLETLRGYKMIISGCPNCIYFMKIKYPELGYELKSRILHISEFLSELMDGNRNLNLKKNNKRIIYHDPCILVRHLGIYEKPRNLLGSISEIGVKEFKWNKREAFCCGGGGGVPITSRQTAIEIARRRLSEIDLTEIDTLVTACPTCESMFKKIENNFYVKDIVNLIAEAI